MPFVDWLVVLAIALLSVAACCRRHGPGRTLGERARRLRGTRLLVRATVALWGALLIVERSLTSPDDASFGLPVGPQAALGVASMLALAGCLWSIRGRRLLRQRRMFRNE